MPAHRNIVVDSDATLAADSDARVASQKATRAYIDAEAAARATADALKVNLSAIDTDVALTANSDTRVPSQKAVKTAIANSGSLTSLTDVHITADSDANASGDIYLTIGATNRARFINGGNYETYSQVSVADLQTGTRTIAAGSAIFKVTPRGNVMAGLNALLPADPSGSPNTFLADFLYSSDTDRLFVRSLIVGENGDPPDLGLRRAEGVYPDGTPAQVLNGTNLGTIWWQGWPSGTGGFLGESAQIYVKASQNITPTAAGGDLHIATTPNGTITPTDRLVISNSGAADFQGNAVSAGSLALTGALTAASSTLTGALSAASASLTGALNAASSTLTGALSSGSVSTTGTVSAGGAISTSAGGGKTTLALSSTSSNTGLTIGGDANLYRSAASTLMTDGSLTVAGTLTAATVSGSGDINATGKLRASFGTGAQVSFGTVGPASESGVRFANSASFILYVDSSSRLHITSKLAHDDQIVYAASALETTGAGSAALGANCPAVTPTAPFKWWKVTTSDGSQGYIPVWK